MTHACANLWVFFEVSLFHEISLFPDFLISWTKFQKVSVFSLPEITHSKHEITYFENIFIVKQHEIKYYTQILVNFMLTHNGTKP